MGVVTVSDLKAEIKIYNYNVLTGGDDDIAGRAIHKATMWCEAKVVAAGAVFDPSLPINREIVIKRALYELYSYAENEEVARDKREDALEMLRAAYGDAVDASGYQGGSVQQNPIPAVSFKKGRISKLPDDRSHA
jgi:hypothetical protein